ncbi:MAG: class I SAM-dependent DNA methyltransferase [Blautia sp.]|jgi:SAM-dependent methyltransferase
MCQTYEEDSYSAFAAVYDIFMDNIDYDAWCAYVHRLLVSEKVEDGLVLDLGCGTGSLTERLAGLGYDMIGVDSSALMLQEAMEKRESSGLDILYLMQDMRELELYGTVRAVVSICDCMNYMTEPEDMLQVFRLVNNYLDPGGIFIFDLNTLYKYETLLGDQTIAENREEGSFIWENEYDSKTRMNLYGLTLFLPREDGLYEKHEEIHYQRGYSLDEVKALLKEAGMEFVASYDAFTQAPPKEDSERIYVLAREKGKQRK